MVINPDMIVLPLHVSPVTYAIAPSNATRSNTIAPKHISKFNIVYHTFCRIETCIIQLKKSLLFSMFLRCFVFSIFGIDVYKRQGQSRSRAVGAFAVEMLGGNSERYFETGSPNQYVYDVLETAWIRRQLGAF